MILSREPSNIFSLNIPHKAVKSFLISFDVLQLSGMNDVLLDVGNSLYLQCTTRDREKEKNVTVNLLSGYCNWKYDNTYDSWDVQLDKQLDFEGDFTQWGKIYQRNPCRMVIHNANYSVHLRAVMNLSDFVNEREGSVKSIQFTNLRSANGSRMTMKIFVTVVQTNDVMM